MNGCISSRGNFGLVAALFSAGLCFLAVTSGFAGVPDDPFAGVSAATNRVQVNDAGFFERFLRDNFSFRKELFSQFAWSREAPASSNIYSRQSIGFEAYKKFSTDTTTFAAFDFQLRLVRRDHYLPVLNDMDGADHDGYFTEIHNLYFDLYNVFNPFLSEEARGSNIGRFNFRAGRFYVPFGLNLQTDTHGTLLQLSNEKNFGFERDWCAGFWGSLTPDIDYNISYLLGSGYDMSFRGQDGLIAARLSLSGRYLNEYGIEGGLSFINGQKLFSGMNAPDVPVADQHGMVNITRGGVDGRYTHIVPGGTMALTAELSAGEDGQDAVLSQLYQADYLYHSRKWGLASQYRRFREDKEGMSAEALLAGEFTWYFRNDVGNSNLHWIKLNVERQLERQDRVKDIIVSLQYYRYW